MDFMSEVQIAHLENDISFDEAAVIVAKRFLDCPKTTPVAKAMLELLVSDLTQGSIVWH